jgi:hypothetical protein
LPAVETFQAKVGRPSISTSILCSEIEMRATTWLPAACALPDPASRKSAMPASAAAMTLMSFAESVAFMTIPPKFGPRAVLDGTPYRSCMFRFDFVNYRFCFVIVSVSARLCPV